MTMRIFSRINSWLSGLEWRWSLALLFWGVLFPAGSFALPAWAARAAGLFSEYSPLSWVLSGFAGFAIYATCVALIGYGSFKSVRARYDEKFFAQTGGVDPLSKVFEGKRIFLNDFVLPSNPFVDGKNFVDCEIVGPANIFLEFNNSINDVKPLQVDAVALNGENPFINGFTFRNCSFRNCTFHRVTLFFRREEVWGNQHLEWLNWISPLPIESRLAEEDAVPQISDQSDANSQTPESEG